MHPPGLNRLPPKMKPLLCVGLCLLAAPSCSNHQSPYPLTEDMTYSSHVKGQDWLRLTDEAESRLEYAEAGLYLDRFAVENPDRANEEFWFRRAANAEKAGDPIKAAEVRGRLLLTRPEDAWLRIDLADDLSQLDRLAEAVEILDYPLPKPEHQLLLDKARVELLQDMERYPRAAALSEQIAQNVGEDEARIWWQRASSFHEKNGDFGAATIALEKALVGYDLAAEEEAVLARLRAFELGEPQNVGDAVAVLRYHPDADRRLASMRYLQQGPFEYDVATFEMALRDTDARVARRAAQELGARSPKGRTAALREVAANIEVPGQVRSACLRSLGSIGGIADLPFLVQALDPEDREAFRAARRSLETLTGQRLGLGLDPDLEARQKIQGQWQAWLSNQASEAPTEQSP